MFKNTNHLGRWLVIAVAIGLMCCSTSLAKKPPRPPGGGGGDDGSSSYTIIRLDDMNGLLEGYADDINESRLIVGTVRDATHGRAAYWTVTQTRRSVESTLHYLREGDFTETVAVGCNELGEIVGAGVLPDGPDNVPTPLYWANPESEALPLPLPVGSSRGTARAISNDGVICGRADGDTAIVWRVTEAGIWGPLVLERNPDAEYEIIAKAVSDQVGGIVTVVGNSDGSAKMWTVTLTEEGGLEPDSESILSSSGAAEGINNLGMVCGAVPPGTSVVWIEETPLILAGDGYPSDINDDGVVVGYSWFSAVVWSSPEANMVRLDKYLKNNSSLDSLGSARAVSESGEIVGYGWSNDTSSKAAFLAIPK